MALNRALYAEVVDENGDDDMSAINARYRTRANKPR